MIPAVAHFVWLGRALPWAYALAVVSAARRGELERVVLHHVDEPDGSSGWRFVAREPGVELQRLRPERRLRSIAGLLDVYRSLDAPAARSNVLRAAILHDEGGIYLDTDTITLASLRPLLDAPAFCGVEHVVLPRTVRQSRSPRVWAGVALRIVVRDVLRRAPRGHRTFAGIAHRFALAANNAVLGAAPASPFVRAMLQGMVALDPASRRVRFALGTHLLQSTIDAHRQAIAIHPPQTFYPLAPEISAHWFRLRGRADLREAIAPDTRIAHWYASVRTRGVLPRIDEAYVRALRERQLFAAAACHGLDAGPTRARTSRWSPDRLDPR